MQEAAAAVPPELAGPGRIERRQTTYWDLHPVGMSSTFRIHFTAKQEARFESPVYEQVAMVDTHPLLVPYEQRWVSLFVVEAQRCGPRLLEDLATTIADATSGWRRSEEYLRLGGSTELVLQKGFGLLLEAPEHLAQIAADVVRAHGATPSLVTGRPERPGFRVLLMAPNFVIARSFRLQRLACP